MYLVKVFILIAIFFSSSIADDFDSIFGENKPKKQKEFDSMFNESPRTKKSEDFMDSLTNAESFNKKKTKFDKLLKKAKNEAYSYKNYSKAYKTLSSAYDMNFDNNKVSKLKNDIKNSESKYLRAKREKERKRRQRELEQERMLAEQRRDRQNSTSVMQAFTTALAKQSHETNKIIAQNNKILQDTYRKIAQQKERQRKEKELVLKKQREKEYSLKRKYEQKRLDEQRKRELALKQQRKKELALRKKREQDRLKEQRKRELALKRQREKQDKERIRQNYLAKLKSGIRLKAKNCFGEHHVGGAVPKISPRVVQCIDVSFTAYCRNSPNYKTSGVLTNMISNSGGCYGDTKRVNPKLSCKAEDYIVKVTRVNPCN